MQQSSKRDGLWRYTRYMTKHSRICTVRLKHLDSRFKDDFRILTAYRPNLQKLRGLVSAQYADIGNRYVFDPKPLSLEA